ncbi:lipid-A-disaccharide synthase-related protein [Baaleninema sp.]|uniref:lipid-A-disaccharide synthase-related protein n=1 Tax=Baaleninema sp. TaxID=3101197 RepID=UPI003D02BFB1
MKLLCLSNGHGEDAIAVGILRRLQQHPQAPELAALPLVGEGRAYNDLDDVPIVGPVKKMPSGGFVYMDGRQLWRDLRGGLVGLTLAQRRVVRTWGREGGAILAVGDIVPLLLAWMSGVNYAFVGTAKSEYYLRDDIGLLPRRTWFEKLESWSGSVYLPWERWLMTRKRCRAVFPRDGLTTRYLQKFNVPAYDLGNPMMDGLEGEPVSEEEETNRVLTVALMPGSRSPEAETNWEQIVKTAAILRDSQSNRAIAFLAPIAPGLDLDPFCRVLETYGWQSAERKSSLTASDPEARSFSQAKATLILTQRAFADCLRRADVAIAMAGTATEQFVGLGKPAIALPGTGPQYTPAFAEAQSRLLGPSLILLDRPEKITDVVEQLLTDPDWLQSIAENGRRRMGEPGASDRIADYLIQLLLD